MNLDRKTCTKEDSGVELAPESFTFSTPAVATKEDRMIFASKSHESFANSFQNCDNFNDDSRKTSDSVATLGNLMLSPIHLPESGLEVNFEFKSPIEYDTSMKDELKFGENKASELLSSKSAPEKDNFFVDESDVASVSTKHGVLPVFQSSIFLQGEYQTCFPGYESNSSSLRQSNVATMNKAGLEIIWENENDSEIDKRTDSMNSLELNANIFNKPSNTANDLPALRDISTEEAYVTSRSVTFGSSMYESLRNDWKDHWRCNDPPAMADSGNSSDLETILNSSICSESCIEAPNLKNQTETSTTLGNEALTTTSLGCPKETTSTEPAVPNDEFQILNESQACSCNKVSKTTDVLPGTSSRESLNEENILNFETLQITGKNMSNFDIENKCSGQSVIEPMQLYEDCTTNSLSQNDQNEELNEKMLNTDTITNFPEEIEMSQEIDILSLNPKSDLSLDYDCELFKEDTIPTKDCDSNTTSVYCLHCKRACFEFGGQTKKDIGVKSELSVSDRRKTVTASERLENCEIRLKKQAQVLLDLFEIDNHLSKAILSALCGDCFVRGVNETEILAHLKEKAEFPANTYELRQSIKQFFSAAINAEIVEKKNKRYFLGISGDAQNKPEIQANKKSSKRKNVCEHNDSESGKDLKEKYDDVKRRKTAPVAGEKSETKSDANLNTKSRNLKFEINGNLSKTTIKASNTKIGSEKPVKPLLLQKKEVKTKAINLETRKSKQEKKDAKTGKLDKVKVLRQKAKSVNSKTKKAPQEKKNVKVSRIEKRKISSRKTAAKRKNDQEAISKVFHKKMDIKRNVGRKTDVKVNDKGKRAMKSSKISEVKSIKTRQTGNFYKTKLRKSAK